MSFDYRLKYQELRSKLIESTDLAYRTGYEQGMKDGQVQAQQQQMADMQAQQQAMMSAQVGPDGQPVDPSQMSPEEQAMMEQEGVSPDQLPMEEGELDSKLAELQSLVQKGEKPKILDLRKIIDELSSVRKNQIEEFKNKNKKVESAQRSLVKNIIKKWSEESKSVTSDLDKILETDGLKLD